MQESIAIKTMCGTTAYKYLYSKGYPLPHINTLLNHLSKIAWLVEGCRKTATLQSPKLQKQLHYIALSIFS